MSALVLDGQCYPIDTFLWLCLREYIYIKKGQYIFIELLMVTSRFQCLIRGKSVYEK